MSKIMNFKELLITKVFDSLHELTQGHENSDPLSVSLNESTFNQFITEDSAAKLEAIRLGLVYYGFGRWGNKGKTTYHTVDGQLVPFKKKRKSVKTKIKPAPEQDPEPIQKPRHSKASINKDNTLVWLPGLVQPEWDNVGEIIGNNEACIATAVATTVSHQLDIPLIQIAKSFIGKSKQAVTNLSSVFSMIKSQIPGLNLSLFSSSVSDAVDDLHKGIPSVLVFASTPSSIMDFIVRNEKKKNWDGIVDVPSYRMKRWSWDPKKPNHALTVVGYDKAHDMLICRDVSNKLNVKGFIKFPRSFAEQHTKIFSVMANKQ